MEKPNVPQPPSPPDGLPPPWWEFPAAPLWLRLLEVGALIFTNGVVIYLIWLCVKG